MKVKGVVDFWKFCKKKV